MRLKTFRAETMAAAMKLVRAELGMEAIIVSSLEDDEAVELVAAIDTTPAQAEDFDTAIASALADDPLDALLEIVDYHKVPAALAERLAEAAQSVESPDPIIALAAALDAVFAFAPFVLSSQAARPILLMGPPGAGKTVTAAKLAARTRLAGRTARLITTDTLRTGAADQFAAYADLLAIDAQIADGPEALRQTFASRRDGILTVIDSAGANPFDAGDMARLRDLVAASAAEPLLVLPSGIDSDEAADMAQAFATLGATRLLATRLDTTRRLGGILSAAHAADLRLCDVGTSPHLADGLAPLNPLAFARLLAAAPADRITSLTAAKPIFAKSAP